MGRRIGCLAMALVCAPLAPAAAQPPGAAPIIQPGAPGQEGRELTPEQAAALGRSSHIAADVKFMQDMIVHHAQAVDMVALLETRTQRQGMRLLGERIAISQSAEIEMMRDWLRKRGEQQPADSPAHGHRHGMAGMDENTPVMRGMLSPAQMKALAAASGPAFDRLFLSGMIQHHQGALDMVDALMSAPGAGEDPQLSDFLVNIVADQSAEIARMQAMLAAFAD